MAKINERFLWALELMDLNSSDVILEIGCGTGVLAELMAEKLTKGKLIAIDQSEAMISKAKKKCERFRNIEFLNTEFLKINYPPESFDKIVSFNVNFFWKNPGEELKLISRLLKPKGRLYIFYQAPYDIDLKISDPVVEILKSNSFGIRDRILKKLKPVSAICIVASLAGN